MAADHRVHVWQVEDGHRAERSRIRARAPPIRQATRESGPRPSRSASGTHATARPSWVAGTDAGLTVEPASALSKLDLPTPVPPTSAST
jgi:hypothetical protein